GQRRREVDEVLDVVPVQFDDERFPAGEVAVERADADAGLPGDRGEGRAAPGGERRAGGGQDALAVGEGIFPGWLLVHGWRGCPSVRDCGCGCRSACRSGCGQYAEPRSEVVRRVAKAEGSPVRWVP